MDHPPAPQLDLFENYKKLNVAYPPQPFNFGPSLAHWFGDELRDPFSKLCAALPENSIYLELGSFLGAGTTVCALNANATLRAYCCDRYSVPGDTHWRDRPLGYKSGRRAGDYFRGRGSQLQHFINNTWGHQKRIAVMQHTINTQFLLGLAEAGVTPDLIMIDDDHEHDPVLEHLRVIAKHWPKAIVVLDDYNEHWDGVRTGFQAAVKEGLYRKEDSELVANRLMVLRGSAFQDADETAEG
jgi:hypothetical protein